MNFERNKTRKLTQGQVQEMRQFYGEGATQGALAKHYGMSVGQVGRIVRGESWREGAGQRMPTQAEGEGILQRLLETQRLKQEREALEAADPLLKEMFGAPEAAVRRPPPSLLDGGDAPSEVDGSALVRLAEDARGTEQGLDKLLGVGGPYSFARKEQK